jgi:hypothetical protein
MRLLQVNVGLEEENTRPARQCGREVEEIHLPSGTKTYNNWVLTFFWEPPLDKVALGELIATENPLVLENLPPQ